MGTGLLSAESSRLRFPELPARETGAGMLLAIVVTLAAKLAVIVRALSLGVF